MFSIALCLFKHLQRSPSPRNSGWHHHAFALFRELRKRKKNNNFLKCTHSFHNAVDGEGIYILRILAIETPNETRCKHSERLFFNRRNSTENFLRNSNALHVCFITNSGWNDSQNFSLFAVSHSSLKLQRAEKQFPASL